MSGPPVEDRNQTCAHEVWVMKRLIPVLILLAAVIAAGVHYWLDLGDVKDVAEVAVNGKYLGILWKTPFKVDITAALKGGSNQLVIDVTNLWVNRLIGDQQSYAVKKYTFTDFTPYKADSPLLPSGLLGPVRITTDAAK